MFPAAFDYVRAESIGHALQLLEEHGDNARLLAGGHSLLPAMKLRLAQPKLLVDIGRLRELQYIREEGNYVTIGSLTTHAALERSALVAEKARALFDAAHVVADVQVRNRGTIGGVLAHADPQADYTAVMLALGAEVVTVGRGGTRAIPIDQFFLGPFATSLAPGEILAEIRIPKAGARSGSCYRKFVRRASDYGLTGVSACLSVAPDGVCTHARIGITCVSLSPYRPYNSEAALVGRKLTPDVIEAAARLAVDGVMVNEDTYTSADYRSHLARVETRKAIEDALSRI